VSRPHTPPGLTRRRSVAGLQLTWAPTILYADGERFNSRSTPHHQVEEKNNCGRRARVGHLEIANVKMSCMRPHSIPPPEFLPSRPSVLNSPSAPCQGGSYFSSSTAPFALHEATVKRKETDRVPGRENPPRILDGIETILASSCEIPH
jgi:hypothetical protein